MKRICEQISDYNLNRIYIQQYEIYSLLYYIRDWVLPTFISCVKAYCLIYSSYFPKAFVELNCILLNIKNFISKTFSSKTYIKYLILFPSLDHSVYHKFLSKVFHHEAITDLGEAH